MPSPSFLRGHWQCESSHKNRLPIEKEKETPPPCFCLQTIKYTSLRPDQINFRRHIEHSVAPFLVSFITNLVNRIFEVFGIFPPHTFYFPTINPMIRPNWLDFLIKIFLVSISLYHMYFVPPIFVCLVSLLITLFNLMLYSISIVTPCFT